MTEKDKPTPARVAPDLLSGTARPSGEAPTAMLFSGTAKRVYRLA